MQENKATGNSGRKLMKNSQDLNMKQAKSDMVLS